MERLYIFGAGEFADIAANYFSEENRYRLEGFVVDDELLASSGETLDGKPVHALSEVVKDFTTNGIKVFVAISASNMNKSRQKVYERLKALGASFATYISPKAYVSNRASIGENVFIFEENVVQLGVTIGNNTVLWSGNHLGHQTKVASHVFFSSHVVVSGFCNVQNNCYFGVNSTLVDHLNIAEGTLVGAGSLILNDTESNSVYIGSPAKKIEGKDPYSVSFR